jgi:hypothetical protein
VSIVVSSHAAIDPPIVVRNDRAKVATGNFIDRKTFRAVLDQCAWAHVVIRRDEELAQRIHKREVPVPAVAWAEEIANRPFKFRLAQTMQEDLNELFFLPRTDIVKRIGGARRFEPRVVLVVINQARIVEDDECNLVSV